MRLAAADAFASWMEVLTERAVDAGIGRARAEAVATEVFCMVEGALLLGRVRRDGEPVRVAGRAAAGLVERALAESRASVTRR
jgi:TetR/AcrR family transcriptional repressor of lmrAB and yxaGH operons